MSDASSAQKSNKRPQSDEGGGPSDSTELHKKPKILDKGKGKAVPQKESSKEKRKFVLAIGVNKYTHKDYKPLQGTEKDVENIVGSFKAKGYETEPTPTQDPTGAQIKAAVEDSLLGWCGKRGGSVIIFFAGHAYSNDGVSYLVGVDGEAYSMEVQDAREYIHKHCCKTVRIGYILDACRVSAEGRGGKSAHLMFKKARQEEFIWYACGEKKESFGSSAGGNFTIALSSAMNRWKKGKVKGIWEIVLATHHSTSAIQLPQFSTNLYDKDWKFTQQ